MRSARQVEGADARIVSISAPVYTVLKPVYLHRLLQLRGNNLQLLPPLLPVGVFLLRLRKRIVSE
jgi:hypothetical protein